MTVNTRWLAEAFPHSVALTHAETCYVAGHLAAGSVAFAITPHMERADHRVVWLSDLARRRLLDAGYPEDRLPAGHRPPYGRSEQ